MFTGITQQIGQVDHIEHRHDHTLRIGITTNQDYFSDSQVGASVMVDGICLTITSFEPHHAFFDIMIPTFKATIVNHYQIGERVNLEKSILATERFDGHFVLGHVDTTARVIQKKRLEETVYFTFLVADTTLMSQIVPKGSIAISGVSLTVINTSKDSFQVGLIPHTVTHTHLGTLEINDLVNIETDILAKYLTKGDA